VEHASLLWRLAQHKVITAFVSDTSITDIFYICRKHAGKDTARSFIADILDAFSLADIDKQGFRDALHSDINDYEDAVKYFICMRNGCDALITRNKAHYGNKANVLDPAELIERLKAPF